VTALLRGRHQPVSVELEVPEQPLEQLTCPDTLNPQEREGRMCLVDTPVPLQGRLSARLKLDGFADRPGLDVSVTGSELRLGNTQPARIALQAGTRRVDGKLGARLDAAVLGGEVSLGLFVERSLAQLVRGPRTPWSEVPVHFSASAQNLALGGLKDTGLIGPNLRGVGELFAQVDGKLGAPVGKVDAKLHRLEGRNLPGPLDARLTVIALSDKLQASLEAEHEGKRLAEVLARLGAGTSSLSDSDRLARAPLLLHANLGPLPLNAFVLGGGERRRDAIRLRGEGRAQLSLEGSLTSPLAALDVELHQLGARRGKSVGDVTLHYRYRDQHHSVQAAFLSQGGGELRVDGGTELDVSWPALAHGLRLLEAPLGAELVARQFNLDFLSGLNPVLRQISGKLDVRAQLKGTFGAPTGMGRLEWQNGGVSVAGFGDYSDIHLLLSANPDHLELTELVAHADEGTLRLKAGANRAGDHFALTGEGKLQRFPIVTDDQLLAHLSLRLSLEGTLSQTQVNFRRVSVPEATFELPDVKRKDLQPLMRPTDIVFVRNGVPIRERRRAPAPHEGTGGSGQAPVQRRYEATLEAPRNLWIKSADISAEVGLSEGFHLELTDALAIQGDVRVLRGRVTLLGRRFDVQRDSRAHFSGPPDEPNVNVAAVYTNDRENVKITATVHGQGKDLSIKTSSEPPLSESEIYTILATGRRTLRPGSGATATGTDQAVSILGSLAATQLKQTLQTKLPLDVLSVEAAESGYGLTGTKLEAGTYVTDKLYVGYAARFGADRYRNQNANTVRLEYQFTPRWSLEAEYGDANVGNAQFIWSKDF
jgi:translocation and assembly module TamB